MAIKFKQVQPGEWAQERIREADVYKRHPKYPGKVMFPSSHDITEANRNACEKVIDNLIDAGNEVLIVSKPHLETIEALCAAYRPYRRQLQFRFSIGSCDDAVLRYWEFNAPCYAERKAALDYAFKSGFVTSVSVEPMLDTANIDSLVADLIPFVTETIWIGKMNHIGRISKYVDDATRNALVQLDARQSDAIIKAIYARHKDNPMIRWKDSIMRVVR
jgi:DNA repair photolyase